MREATFFSSAAVYSDAEGAETVLLSVPPEPGRSSSATPAASASQHQQLFFDLLSASSCGGGHTASEFCEQVGVGLR